MKALKVILIIFVVLAALLGVGGWYVNRYVQSPEFKAQVLAAATKATGTSVEIAEMKVSIFSGIELRGVTIANSAEFSGNFLTAKAFTLRYNLWSLLHQRIDVETLVLDTPFITLAKNAKGAWNYDKLGGPTEKVKASTTTPKPSAGKFDLSLQRVEMNNASVVMLKDGGKELLRIQDATFASSIHLEAGKISGSGRASIALVNAANSLLILNVATPVTLTAEAVKLAPITGKIADGDLTGDAALSLAGDSTYSVTLHVKDAAIVTLFKEAGVAKQIFSSGKLQLNTALTGTGGLETIVGTGKMEITGGQLVDIPLLSMIGGLLQIPALQKLKFDECLVEFSISNNVMVTPVISLKSSQVQIIGNGSVSLADYSLNHTLTLALAAGALDHTPKEIRNVFTQRADGFYTLDFKVWGPYDAPKTDLSKKLLKGATDQLLEKGLKFLK